MISKFRNICCSYTYIANCFRVYYYIISFICAGFFIYSSEQKIFSAYIFSFFVFLISFILFILFILFIFFIFFIFFISFIYIFDIFLICTNSFWISYSIYFFFWFLKACDSFASKQLGSSANLEIQSVCPEHTMICFL